MDYRVFIRKIIQEALEFNNNKTFIPPSEVIAAAKSALANVGNNSSDTGGNKGSGSEKAKQLAQGMPQTFPQMKRLLSFFRTEENGDTKNSSSWALHGGDKAFAWAKRELEGLHGSNLRSKKVARTMGGAGINKGMGTADTGMMDPNKRRESSVWSAIKNRK